MIDLFLRGTEVDEYVATNLFGKKRLVNDLDETVGENTLLDGLNVDDTFPAQMRLLQSYSLAEKKDRAERGKMNAFETYIAVIKGYYALMILVLPRAFVRGGYVLAPVVLGISGALQAYCALKLVRAGQALNLPSYSLITLKALGPTAKCCLDFMIAST